MLIHQTQTEVISSGVVESKQFTIAANAKAFRILIDSLYSDKPRAIIRELWSNARDAHFAAGNENIPFECHLPSLFAPEFKLRDYGTGLSHDDVLHLFTQVFASTKDGQGARTQEEADAAPRAVGKFGLGSKTPFGYTEQYSTVSYFQGVKRHYSMYIDSNGVPSVALFAEEETDEPNGLEISFPIQHRDIDSFVNAAQRVAFGLEVQPVFTNKAVAEFEQPVISAYGDGWRIYADTPLYDGLLARQGGVLYPIDLAPLGPLQPAVAALANANIIFDFEVGDVDITPSRESLSYDKDTVASVKKALEKTAFDINGRIQEILKNAPTHYCASMQYNELIRSLNLPTSVQNAFRSQAKWRGKSIPVTQRFYEIRNKAKSSALQYAYVDWKGKVKLSESSSDTVDLSQVIYILADTSVRISRQKERLKTLITTLKNRLSFSPQFILIDEAKKSIAFKKIWSRLGYPPFIELSQVVLPKKEYYKYDRSKGSLKTLNNSEFYDTDHDPEDGGIYVDLYRDDPVGRLGKYSLKKVFGLLQELGIIDSDEVLYGIPASLKNIPNKYEGWVNLYTILDSVKDMEVDASTSEALEAYSSFFRTSEIQTLEEILTVCPELADVPGSPFLLLKSEKECYEYLAKTFDEDRSLLVKSLLGSIGVPESEWNVKGARFKPANYTHLIYQEVNRRYPLLSRLETRRGSNSSVIADAINYIKLVDKALA